MKNVIKESSLTTFRPIDEDPASGDDEDSAKNRLAARTQRTLTQIRTSGLFTKLTSVKTNEQIRRDEDVNLISEPKKEVITILQPNPNRKMFSPNDSDTGDNSPKSPTPTGGDSNRYNLSNLLKQIYSMKYSQKPSSSMMAEQGARSAAESGSTGHLKQFWMPDDQVKECFECNEKFTTFRRRHHCRVCGQIFCGKCSDHEIPSHLIWPNTTGNIRSCTFCHSFVGEMETGDLKTNSNSIRELMKRLSLPTTSSSSTQMNEEQSSSVLDTLSLSGLISQSVVSPPQVPLISPSSSTNSLNSLTASGALSTAGLSNLPNSNQQSQSVSSNMSSSLVSTSAGVLMSQQGTSGLLTVSALSGSLDENNPFDVADNRDYFKANEHEEIKQLIINKSSELRNLWVQVYHTSDGIQFTSKSINKFKKINNCITGHELVEWLMKKKSVSKDQAIVIGQALIDGKWLELVHQASLTTSSINSLTSYYNQSSSKFDQIFYDDSSLYKPGPAATNYNRSDQLFDKVKSIQDTDEGPEWIKDLNKLVTSNLDAEETVSSDILTTGPNLGPLKIIDTHLGNDPSSPVVIIDYENKIPENFNQHIKLPPNEIHPNTDNKVKFDDDVASIASTSSSSSSGPRSPPACQFKPSPKLEPGLAVDSEAPPRPPTPIHHTLADLSDSLTHTHKQLHVEILKQLLKLKNISFDWFDVISSLTSQCVHLVRPDVKHDNDSMDIRSYIKIKKLPYGGTGLKTDSHIVNGLVFSKNIANRNMKSELKQPRVLLLRSSIEYQRTEEKMCSLDPILAAEAQYLKNYCSKLFLRHNPDILIVEKSVARIAQEYFLQAGVTLILNVKSSIMDKLCRFLQADPMYSIDDPIRKPKLGFCSNFHVENFKISENRAKSLMFFEGTPTNLGCTILLSGASLNELATVKSIIRFMIYVYYNSKLENSFILDKCADFSLKNTMFEIKNDDSYLIPKLDKSSNESQSVALKEEQLPKSNTKKEKNENEKSRKVKLSISKEITIDQSPLDEVKFGLVDDQDDDDEKEASKNEQQVIKHSRESSQSSISAENQPNGLKLTICGQHQEKINLGRAFKLLKDDLILSCSPFITFQMPFLLLESLNSTDDQLRKYLPASYMNYLKSEILLRDSQGGSLSPNQGVASSSLVSSFEEAKNPNLHEFLLIHLTKSFDDQELRRLYADFKSRGGISSLNGSSSTATRRLILKENPETSSPDKRLKGQPFDCLDIYNRQQLAVLFYSQCESSPVYPNICIKPRIINMKFYGENDMTLGAFLAKNCFRNGYKCNNEMCDTLIVYHTRTFVHSDSKITVRMSIVPTANPQPVQHATQTNQSSQPNSQKQATSDQLTSQPTGSSQTNSQFSNLSVSALSSISSSSSVKSATTNPRGGGQILSIASMIPTTVSSKSSPALSVEPPKQPSRSSSPLPQPAPNQATSQQPVYDDINIFMWSVCKICNRSTNKVAMSPDTWSFSLAKFLELTFHARNYHQFNGDRGDASECCKHSLFQDNYQYFRFKNVVTVFSTSKIVIKSLHIPEVWLKSNAQYRPREEYIDEIKELYEKGLSLFLTLVERISSLKTLSLNDKQLQKLDQFIAQINSDTTLRHKIEKLNLQLTNKKSTKNLNEYLLMNNNQSVDMLGASPNVISNDGPGNETEEAPSETVNYELIEMLLIDLRRYIAASVNIWNTRMSEFFKKPKFEEDSVTNNESSASLSSTPVEVPKFNTFKLPNVAIQKDDECTLVGKQVSNESVNESGTSLLNESTSLKQTGTNLEQLEAAAMAAVATDLADHNKLPTALQLGKRLIANLMPSSAFQPIKMPFPDDEHYLTTPESFYYVNEKSLTSIVAFSLGSKEYKDFQAYSSKLDMIKLQQQASIGLNPNLAVGGNPSGSSMALLDQDDFDFNPNTSNKSPGAHFELQFHDSTTKFYCRAYFAELFSRLRKVIMPNDEERYIHSLFQCINWEAKGGKSNSQFRKTLDNRFVIKEMSKQENQSFLDFAPHYIQYMIDCVQSKRATAFAKIVGAYRICLMKNTTIGSKAVKIDVIVMENLFYGKKCQQVFDLKGSERNRLVNVQAGGKSGNTSSANLEKELVLLDENFLRWSFDNPIYIKPHSKYVLMRAIENDSQFLSSKFVMDYSLLCGFDQTTNDIVVGIIDYLRVFTWDKKVETYIKTIGGQGKMPTIVSPEVYRTRFINAIDRYFLEVPDQWYNQDLAKNDPSK